MFQYFVKLLSLLPVSTAEKFAGPCPNSPNTVCLRFQAENLPRHVLELSRLRHARSTATGLK